VVVLKFRVRKKDKFTKARLGVLKLENGKTIKTPVLWIGDQIKDCLNIWEKFNVNTIMFNSYDILYNVNESRLNKKNRIHEYVGDEKISIMMDSGGYLFQKKRTLAVSPKDILELYKSTMPDIAVVLDHPLNPMESSDENRRRWSKTIENTKFMWEDRDGIVLMPVVHGYTLNELKKACDEIKRITEPELVVVGLGSMVPLIRAIKNVGVTFRNNNGNSKNYGPLHYFIDAIKLVRSEFPDSFLHVFGIGSVSTMHLLFSLGVDSVDTLGWRLKAAHGAIQLPGVGDRFIAPNGKRKRKKLSEVEEVLLEKCRCPVCRGLKIEERKKKLSNGIKNGTFDNRAIHNAWVFYQECLTARRMIGRKKYLEFTAGRLKNTIYRKYLDYAFNSSLGSHQYV